MRAAVFHQLGKPLSIETLPDPEPEPRELILKVRSCGICGSDLHVSSLPPGLPPGTVMGHEFAGEVVEVGAEVRGEWSPGDRICALPYIGCGRCRACLGGDGGRCPDIRTTGLGQIPGAYAELVRVGSDEALRLPDSLSFREGALVEPLSVGLHAVKEADLRPGENALVLGAGPVGLATAQWARFFGARSVVVAEKSAARLELAGHFGATHRIDASSENLAVAFQRAAGAAPDVIFECVGLPGMIQQCVMLAPARGRVMVVGVCMQPDTLLPLTAILKEIAFKFVLGYRKRDFQLTIDMLQSERIRGAPMVTHSVGLDDFADAFEALKHPTTQCKVVLEPDS